MSLRQLLSKNTDKLKRIFPGMRSEWFLVLMKGIDDIETNNTYKTFVNAVSALKYKPPTTELLTNMKQYTCGSNGCVYYNARYLFPNNSVKYVAVKKFKDFNNEEQKVLPRVFIEVLIQIILSFKNDYNTHLKVPEPIFFGKFKGEWVFVMEQIKNTKMLSEVLSTATKNDMYAYLLRLCNGLFKIQENFNFMHRDLHGDNIIFDMEKNEMYMIDFGFSCIGVRNIKRPYSFTSQNAKTCHNDSHDICMCLLSLYFQVVSKRRHLFKIVSEICSTYRTLKPYVPRSSIDKQYPAYTYNSKKPVFHWWYLYDLTDIETKYTPKYLSTIKCLNPLKEYFGKLKF